MTNLCHEQGSIENLFFHIGYGNQQGGGILIMRIRSLNEAKSYMETLPLALYFESINHVAIDKVY